jgi:hypothetical protein
MLILAAAWSSVSLRDSCGCTSPMCATGGADAGMRAVGGVAAGMREAGRD